MSLTLSCAFATSQDTPEHARVAEKLGYACAYFYDSPALYPDVWVQLCRAGDRTERIVLGPGVLVPSNRHPMTNAAAIATLASLVGQHRVVVGVGSGFTARMAMGQRPLRWSFIAEYVRALQALLRGHRVRWEGAPIEMLHLPGFAPPRPIEVPFLIGADGPKGISAARELGAGVFTVKTPVAGFHRSVLLTFGTVLDEGEDEGSERALAAAGPGASVALHYRAEYGLVGERTAAWLARYEVVPEETRHLAMHRGHLVSVNEHDRPFITGELLSRTGLALTASAWRERLARLEAGGATEVAYAPAGPDIERELQTFATAARG